MLRCIELGRSRDKSQFPSTGLAFMRGTRYGNESLQSQTRIVCLLGSAYDGKRSQRIAGSYVPMQFHSLLLPPFVAVIHRAMCRIPSKKITFKTETSGKSKNNTTSRPTHQFELQLIPGARGDVRRRQCFMECAKKKKRAVHGKNAIAIGKFANVTR